MRKFQFYLLLILSLLALACEKTIDNNGPNPFSDGGGEDTSAAALPLTTIQGLHQNVFAVRCANPTCHDGSFEPDFRTVQSTYSSLVYHPVVKNDDQGSYQFRVLPGNAAKSWLMHRVTTDDEVLGRMPLYAQPLSSTEVDAIYDWIERGAPDMFGNLPSFPNLPPTVHGYQLQDSIGDRVDFNRVSGWASAMQLNDSSQYTFYYYVTDDSSSTADLKDHLVEFSLDRDNFQPFAQISATMLWTDVTTATFNTADFSAGTTVYFRYRLKDEEGAETQFPSNASEFWYKEHFSFTIL